MACCRQSKQGGEVEVLYLEADGTLSKRRRVTVTEPCAGPSRYTMSSDEDEADGEDEDQRRQNHDDDEPMSQECQDHDYHRRQQGQRVWCSKHPTASNEEATKCFLQLRGSTAMKTKFANKRILKKTLWQEIAQLMASHGYVLGENGAEKCHQKFANLQNRYLAHRTHLTKTGGKRREAPPYYAMMHSILGDKAKAHPLCIIDTEEENPTRADPVAGADTQEGVDVDTEDGAATDDGPATNDGAAEDIENRPPEAHPAEGNRFQGIKTRIRGQSNTDKILAAIQQASEATRRGQDAQFKRLEQLLQVQNEQRDRLLDILERKL